MNNPFGLVEGTEAGDALVQNFFDTHGGAEEELAHDEIRELFRLRDEAQRAKTMGEMLYTHIANAVALDPNIPLEEFGNWLDMRMRELGIEETG